MMIAGAVALAVTMAGCRNEAEGWYPISGGYINLRNVHVITTGFAVNGPIFSDYPGKPITRESIALSKKQVAESIDVPRITKAYIKFDDFTVNLPTEAESKKDVLRLLDAYLEMVEDLELPVK